MKFLILNEHFMSQITERILWTLGDTVIKGVAGPHNPAGFRYSELRGTLFYFLFDPVNLRRRSESTFQCKTAWSISVPDKFYYFPQAFFSLNFEFYSLILLKSNEKRSRFSDLVNITHLRFRLKWNRMENRKTDTKKNYVNAGQMISAIIYVPIIFFCV